MYDDDPDYGDYSPGDCPKCDAVDYGFELPDERTTYRIPKCGCKERGCQCTDEMREEHGVEGCICADECQCESLTASVRINRIWDKRCSYCGQTDWRPEWQVVVDRKVVATTPTEDSAEAVLHSLYPDAEEDHDPAWESEKWLRRAEGWG